MSGKQKRSALKNAKSDRENSIRGTKDAGGQSFTCRKKDGDRQAQINKGREERARGRTKPFQNKHLSAKNTKRGMRGPGEVGILTRGERVKGDNQRSNLIWGDERSKGRRQQSAIPGKGGKEGEQSGWGLPRMRGREHFGKMRGSFWVVARRDSGKGLRWKRGVQRERTAIVLNCDLSRG